MFVKYNKSIIVNLAFGLAVLAGAVLGVAIGSARAQAETERYYDETGHTVRGLFLLFFESHGGEAIFGYPLTNEFVENGRLVQYFQRAKFEWHPENHDAYQVQLALLGDNLGYGKAPVPTVTNPRCVYFFETGHSVCDAFLDYFRAHGGLDVFGYPITEYYSETDRVVQVFQRMRMEWHPDRPSNEKVQLSGLGYLALKHFKVSKAETDPQGNISYAVTRLNTKASVKLPVTGRSGEQTIYVLVKDQLNKPLAGAFVTILVRLPTGATPHTLPLTDANGKTETNFSFGETRFGDYVFIDVSITYQNLAAVTRTSFLPWR